jgi:acyl-CoA dehydrogenase
MIDQGHRAIKELSMAKAFTTEMFYRVMDRSMQVHGAMGLTNELRLEEGLRLARTQRIPDGTGEIQRRNVVRQMRRGDVDILRN